MTGHGHKLLQEIASSVLPGIFEATWKVVLLPDASFSVLGLEGLKFWVFRSMTNGRLT